MQIAQNVLAKNLKLNWENWGTQSLDYNDIVLTCRLFSNIHLLIINKKTITRSNQIGLVIT